MLIIFSCEHGGNDIPVMYQALFKDAQDVLTSHRGYDYGALPIFLHLAQVFPGLHVKQIISRLLIDCNRSLHYKNLFSEWTSSLAAADKRNIVDQYYRPYRQQLISAIAELLAKNTDLVVHFSIHSFVPIFKNVVRRNDIGLLYDPSHGQEAQVCRKLRRILQQQAPQWLVLSNVPYRGTSDGFTTFLRRLFGIRYCGIELEFNQRIMGTEQEAAQIASKFAQAIQTLRTNYQLTEQWNNGQST